jgi:hypothetical protein
MKQQWRPSGRHRCFSATSPFAADVAVVVAVLRFRGHPERSEGSPVLLLLFFGQFLKEIVIPSAASEPDVSGSHPPHPLHSQ